MKMISFLYKGLGKLGYSGFTHILCFLISIPVFAAPKIFSGEVVVKRRQISNELVNTENVNLYKKNSLTATIKVSQSSIVDFDSKRFSEECQEAAKQIGQNIENISCEPNYVFEVSATPNDSHTKLQYAQQLMQLPEAWEITQGDNSVIVAVIDTGVDLTHEDLINNIWINRGEIDGNGIDDDANGLIDDFYGADFTDDLGSGVDQQGHGTHVAGIIGGQGNNSLGISGVAWNVKIMSLRFIGSSGYGSSINAARAIDYAVANGAKIINASWGAIGAQSSIIEEAIKRARDQGVLFVAAAGNDGVNTDNNNFYPAGFEVSNIISVGASDSNDQQATFSNYGVYSVDVSAPGVGIISSYPTLGYGYLSGTSMAAPQVSGLAALLVSLQADISPQSLKHLIIENGEAITTLTGASFSGKRINAYQSLLALSSNSIGKINQTYSLTISNKLNKFNINLSSSAAQSVGEMQLALKIGNFSCDLSSFDFNGDTVRINGKFNNNLVGRVEFLVSNSEGELARSLLKMKVKNKLNKKGLKAPINIAKLSISKKESLCRSLTRSLVIDN